MKTYNLTEEQIKEIVRESFLRGNNFGAENPNSDEDYLKIKNETIEKVFNSLVD